MTWDVHAPTYQPHASQFAFGLRGSCTLLALAACDVIAKGMAAYVLDPHSAHPNPASAENVQTVMYRLYKQARAHINPATGQLLCGPNGSATQSDVLVLAGLIGLPVHDVLHYSENLPSGAWVAFLRRNIAHVPRPYPVLVQVDYGAALKDALSGAQDEASLRCHAFTLFGTQTDPADDAAGGFIACDGDSPAIANHPVVYSLQTLAAAHPISMVAFDFVGVR